jgi:hypothetical protein
VDDAIVEAVTAQRQWHDTALVGAPCERHRAYSAVNGAGGVNGTLAPLSIFRGREPGREFGRFFGKLLGGPPTVPLARPLGLPVYQTNGRRE